MAILEGKRVTKSFGGLTAVNRVSFKIEDNDIFGLIGPNGAGKTTLFNVIVGRYNMDEGQIIYKGKDITGFPPYEVCTEGMVRTFQVVKPLKGMNVLDNVMVGAFLRANSVSKAREKAQYILGFLGMKDKSTDLAKNLTAADLKRLELARALATEPTIMLIDEAFAGLNPAEIKELVDLIKKIRENAVTIFMIEHVMGAIMNLADKIMVLHEGSKIAEGSPMEIQGNELVQKVYLGTT